VGGCEPFLPFLLAGCVTSEFSVPDSQPSWAQRVPGVSVRETHTLLLVLSLTTPAHPSVQHAGDSLSILRDMEKS
jgi:hypothetical protein